jgi:hypothetical protein
VHWSQLLVNADPIPSRLDIALCESPGMKDTRIAASAKSIVIAVTRRHTISGLLAGMLGAIGLV